MPLRPSLQSPSIQVKYMCFRGKCLKTTFLKTLALSCLDDHICIRGLVSPVYFIPFAIPPSNLMLWLVFTALNHLQVRQWKLVVSMDLISTNSSWFIFFPCEHAAVRFKIFGNARKRYADESEKQSTSAATLYVVVCDGISQSQC